MKLAAAIFILAALLVSGCPAPPENNQPPATGSRYFYLGFTPFPYDFTSGALVETYQLLPQNADIIAHHFDDGIPWPEALSGATYDQNITSGLDFRLAQLADYDAVYLALTPVNNTRDGLAKYWGEQSNLPLPEGWQELGFNHPNVVAAYINHCRYMIERFKPDYMAYGIEANLLYELNPSLFPDYLEMASRVYVALKAEYPDLPLFITIQIDSYHRNPDIQEPAIRQLLELSDMVAVSSYPYTDYGDPDTMPSEWFSRVAALAPEKPFAIAETGFIAEDLHLSQRGIEITGTPQYQSEYIDFLLAEAEELQAEFVIWFVIRDYDLGWQLMESLGVDELFKLWRDSGLLDGDGQSRPGLEVWRIWLARARVQ